MKFTTIAFSALSVGSAMAHIAPQFVDAVSSDIALAGSLILGQADALDTLVQGDITNEVVGEVDTILTNTDGAIGHLIPSTLGLSLLPPLAESQIEAVPGLLTNTMNMAVAVQSMTKSLQTAKAKNPSANFGTGMGIAISELDQVATNVVSFANTVVPVTSGVFPLVNETASEVLVLLDGLVLV